MEKAASITVRYLPLLGGAASPSEKTARGNIIPQAREEVKRRGEK
jgi:hypothetical protein